jgi:hypothetical protein
MHSQFDCDFARTLVHPFRCVRTVRIISRACSLFKTMIVLHVMKRHDTRQVLLDISTCL